MKAVELRLVGRLTVVVEGRHLTAQDIGTRKARQLLQVLAAEPTRPHDIDRLTEALWGDDAPRSPADNLATLVSRLRGVLDPDVVRGDRTGWQLGPAVEVDVERAASLVQQADDRLMSGQPGLAAAAATTAVGLLSGPVLADQPDAPWADEVRDRVATLLRRARELAARAALEGGDPAAARQHARAAIDADPLDETAVRLVMAAERDLGDPSRALVAYERLRQVLADELGTDPGPQTRALHLEVLTEHRPEVDAAGDAAAVGAGAARGRSAPPRQPQGLGLLAGRDVEYGDLSARWSDAVAGRPSMVLVAGEPGIGKTRVTAELASLVTSTGGTVLRSRCYEAERSMFVQPVVDALRDEVARMPAALLRDVAGDRAASLALVLPDVAELLGPTANEGRDPEVERRLAYESVITLLRRMSARSPVLLLLDDLHNAGLSTLEQLHLLARRLGESRVLVVATVRTTEGAEALRRLSDVSYRLELGPIDAAAVAELAAASGLADHAESITARTGGRPLFVVETLRAMRDGVEGIPASLAEAVGARVDLLDPPTAELVRAAAVLGASFDPATLASLLGVAETQALRGCEQLVDARLATPSGRVYEFANDMVQEVLYATTPEPVRHTYHRLAADGLADRPESLAVHAAASGQWARAAVAWLAAGDAASSSFAVADAERLLGSAVDAAATAGDDELLGHALLERGEAREVLSLHQGAIEDFSAALDVARTVGLTRLEMLVHRELAGDAPVALGRPLAFCTPHLDRGLELARMLGDRGVEADLLARMAVLSCNRLDYVTGREHGLRAVAAGRASGEERALRRGLDGLKTTYAYLGDLDGLKPVADELEPMARRSADLFVLQWVVFERFFVPLAAGDWAAATATVEEALALNRRSGRLKYEGWFLAHLGWIARLEGRVDDAIGHGRRSIEEAAGAHSWFGATACSMLACTLLAADLDRYRADAVLLLRNGLASADRSGAESYRLRCLAPLALATGDRAVLVHADRLLAGARFPDGRAWLAGVDAYLALGAAWRAAGDPARAAAVLEPLAAAGRSAGWQPVLDAAGVGDLLAACHDGRPPQQSPARRAATRSAPSEGTGR